MANDGLFELENDLYTLKLNMKKVKTIEKMLDVSFISEVIKTEGMLSFAMLDAIFAVALYDVNDEKAVKGQKAVGILEKLLEDVGYSELIAVVTGKIEEDLGFLFR